MSDWHSFPLNHTKPLAVGPGPQGQPSAPALWQRHRCRHPPGRLARTNSSSLHQGVLAHQWHDVYWPPGHFTMQVNIIWHRYHVTSNLHIISRFIKDHQVDLISLHNSFATPKPNTSLGLVGYSNLQTLHKNVQTGSRHLARDPYNSFFRSLDVHDLKYYNRLRKKRIQGFQSKPS